MPNPDTLYHYIPGKYVPNFFKHGLLVRTVFEFSSVDPDDAQIPMCTKVNKSVFKQERSFLQDGIVKYVKDACTLADAFGRLKFYTNDCLKNYPRKLPDEIIYKFANQLRCDKGIEARQLETYFEFEREIMVLKNQSEYISCWSSPDVLSSSNTAWERHGAKGIRLKVRTKKLEKMFQRNADFIVQLKAVTYLSKDEYEKEFKQVEEQYDSKTRSDWIYIKKNDFCDEQEYRFVITPSLDNLSALFKRIQSPKREKYLYFPEIMEIVEEIDYDPRCTRQEIERLKEFFPNHLTPLLDWSSWKDCETPSN